VPPSTNTIPGGGPGEEDIKITLKNNIEIKIRGNFKNIFPPFCIWFFYEMFGIIFTF
jgi:hypothetical protein